MRMIEAVRAAIGEEMERDDRVLVMGEDVGRKGGVFGATDGLYARFGEARVLDTPLAESGIVGVAIGAALNGLIPIAEIQFATRRSIRSSARQPGPATDPTATGLSRS
jgi:2-oxoisovalerate dehydrogenase E1 component beta subunit